MDIKKIIQENGINIGLSGVFILIAFVVGMIVAGAGKGDIAAIDGEVTGVAEKIKDLEGQLKQINENKQEIASVEKDTSGLNSEISSFKRDVSNMKTLLNSMNSKFTRDISVLKSSRNDSKQQQEQLEYLDKILGLKWVRRPDDGHLYCRTPYPLPWHYAQDFARKIGGNLAVINDEAENKWLKDSFGSKTEYWIGLTDEHSEGEWKWVDGTDAEYLNWSAGEPDNFKQMQHYVIFNKQTAQGGDGKWNDVVGDEIKIGIIEIGN